MLNVDGSGGSGNVLGYLSHYADKSDGLLLRLAPSEHMQRIDMKTKVLFPQGIKQLNNQPTNAPSTSASHDICTMHVESHEYI